MFTRLRLSRKGGYLDAADAPFLIGGTVAVALLLGACAFMLDASALDVWTGLILMLVLIAGSVPLLRWVARKEQDPWLFKVLFSALVVHLLFALLRYFVIFVIYKGNGDAGRYHVAGAIFSRRLRDGVPIHPIEVMTGFPVESQRIGDFTGWLYTITGPSAYAGFFFFTYLCYWGQVLVVRAFRVAVPEGDYRRLALLILFLPSLLFWPASIGKESLMIACLGVIVYGGALLLAPKPQIRGAVFFVVGILLVVMVRPHVALISVGGLGLAMAVGLLGGFRGGDGGSGRGRGVRLIALAVLVVLAGVASTRLGETLKEGNSEGAAAGLEDTTAKSAQGGSQFVPIPVSSPEKFPGGFATVFFRPFPWEASSLNSLIAGGESLLLLGLFAVSWRRVFSFPSLAMRRPFLMFCATYIVLFVIAFSYLANFGILARQRVQVLPILMVVLALPKWYAKRPVSIGAAEDDQVPADTVVVGSRPSLPIWNRS